MVARNDSEMEITNEEFNQIIHNSPRLIVVDFFAEWCFPCLMLSPIIEEMSDKIKEVKFVKINVDENPELAKKYNVLTIPCLIVFKDGQEVNRIIGAQDSGIIEKKVRDYL